MTNLFALASGLRIPTKRKVFVSYHHGLDQYYYDEFSRLFSNKYNIVTDNSLERKINSTDNEYVMRRIRENNLTGSSCTIVLFGKETYKRKFIDWEMKATLEKEHGALGIILPTVSRGYSGEPIVNDRFLDNFHSRYTVHDTWENIVANPSHLASLIEVANNKKKSLINNTRAKQLRNK